MEISKRPFKNVLRRLAFIAVILWPVLLVAGQGAQDQRPESSAHQPTVSAQPSSGNISTEKASSGHQHDKNAQTEQAPAETRISPQEAEELFRSVDKIINFSSQDTGLPVLHAVKRQLINRDRLTAYLEKHMEKDKDSQRLKRSELVLKKFGLLPRDFDLHSFLLSLLREQVAGYYDVETKTVNLLDWVDAEQQKPVLAHELTHALQDQSFHLEKWMKVGDADLALSDENPTPADIERDEAQTVRQAVVEGQAMAVLVDYMLAPTGQSLTTSPQIVEALKAGMLVGTADSVHFQNAPIFLKEILTFPYRYGLDFVSDVLTKDGKQKAFAGILGSPPHTTREIMEPKTYLAGQRVEPLQLPDFARLMKDYQKFDVGSMGEFDVALLLDEYAGTDASKALYPDWRGGYYYAAHPKGDPGAPLAMVYVSQWVSPETAQKFATIYADSLKKRYRSVRVVTAEAEPQSSGVKPKANRDNHEWLTEEGDVVIDVQDRSVFISESVDDVTSETLREAVFSGQPKLTELSPDQLMPLCSPISSWVNSFSISMLPSRPARTGTLSPSR
ncbi:MAG TPA: hypothetical protein VF011_11635 [Terriglobales bacterium]